MTSTLPPDFLLRSVTVNDKIAQIGRLRVIAWNSVLPAELTMDSWLDEFDSIANHWGIFHHDRLVASARLTLHDSLSNVPDAVMFSPLVDVLP